MSTRSHTAPPTNSDAPATPDPAHAGEPTPTRSGLVGVVEAERFVTNAPHRHQLDAVDVSITGMRRTLTATAAALLLVGAAACSSSPAGDPKPAATVTATATPSLSAAQARQACLDAWRTWLDNEPADYNAEADPAPTLPACAGRTDGVDLEFEAVQERNAENRGKIDDCLADPTCTSLPIP